LRNKPINLNGRHVVVTGASRGIGAALAQAAADKGAKLTLVARSEGSLCSLAKKLDAEMYALDLSDSSAVENAIDEIEQKFGSIDVLINNAAFNQVTAFLDCEVASIRQHVETNLIAPIELCRQLMPRLIKRGSGAIVMISSIGGEIAIPHNQLYNATKAGLNMFTSTVQREISGSPINLMLVWLGAVDTEMLEAGKKDPLIAKFSEKLNIKALSPDVVAREVVSALSKGRGKLVLPSYYSFMCAIRMIPSGLNDLLMRGAKNNI